MDGLKGQKSIDGIDLNTQSTFDTILSWVSGALVVSAFMIFTYGFQNPRTQQVDQDLLWYCWHHVPEYKDSVGLNDLTAKSLGGISNTLWRISVKNSKDYPRVLIRHYGKEQQSALIDREREELVFEHLGKVGFGPKFYADVPGGRIEGFLDGSKALSDHKQLMTDEFVGRIGAKVAEMHKLTVPGIDHEAQLWEVLGEWVQKAKMVKFPEDSPATQVFKDWNWDDIQKELDWAQTVLPSPKNEHGKLLLTKCSGMERKAKEFLYDTVFCHNALLGGNIMFNESTKKMHLIDYEYANYNYRGQDIAGHFSAIVETMYMENPNADWDVRSEDVYPNREVQTKWLRRYLDVALEGEDRNLVHNAEFMDCLLKEIIALSMCAELRWSIWGYLSAFINGLDGFDYARYAVHRMNAYHTFKVMSVESR